MKMTKRLMAIAMCGVMAASSMVGMSTNASFYATQLVFCGSIPERGLTFKHMVSIDITNGVIKGKTSAYETYGNEIPWGSVETHVDIFTSYGGWCGGNTMTITDEPNCTASATAEAQAGKKYYCIGRVRIDNDNDGSLDNNPYDEIFDLKTETIS